jgi:yecA family protein
MFTAREKKYLQKFYTQKIIPPSALSIDALEGFIYGVAIAPGMLPPSEWVPVALGDDPPAFQSQKEANNFFGKLFALYNRLSDKFSRGTLKFPFDVNNLSKSELAQLKRWCDGFCGGMFISESLWENAQQFDEEENISPVDLAFTPFLMIANTDCPLADLNNNESDEDISFMIHSLPLAMETLIKFMQQVEVDNLAGISQAQQTGSSPKIGRNDPCPCGSGRKYKKCCIDKPFVPEQSPQLPSQPSPKIAPLMNAREIPEFSSGERRHLHEVINAQITGRGTKIPPEDTFENFTRPALLFELMLFYQERASTAKCQAFSDLIHDQIIIELSLVRDQLRKNEPEAAHTLKLLNVKFAEIATLGEVGLELYAIVCNAMRINGLPITKEIKDLYKDLLLTVGHEKEFSTSDLGDSTLLQMFKSHGVTDPYIAFDLVLQTLQLMESDEAAAMALNMAQSDEGLLREIAALFVLYPESEVRRLVLQGLVGFAADFSPQTLARLILIRNWVPDNERPGIDSCIKAARKAGVNCANFAEAKKVEYYASPIDGNNAQLLCMVNKKTLHVLLWKKEEGVVDAWSNDIESAEWSKMKSKLIKETGGAAIEGEFIEKVINHAISLNADSKTVVPLGLLESAERLGVSSWKAMSIDIGVIAANLNQEAREQRKQIFTPRAQVKIADESFDWIVKKKFANSWFEDHPDIEKILYDELGSVENWELQTDKGVSVILEQFLEKKRAKWLERFLLTTLWLKNHTGRAPLAWHKMLCMFNMLNDGCPVKEHPLMQAVAYHTFWAACYRQEVEHDEDDDDYMEEGSQLELF